MFQTDSDEDVIFVSEKSASKSQEISIDEEKRLALQRDIDQESLPWQSVKPSTNQRSVAVESPVEMVKMKTEEDKSEENCIKKERKCKKGQVYDDGSLAEVKKAKKKSKKIETVVIEEELWDGVGEKEEKKKKKKRKLVHESLNDANGSDVTESAKDEGVGKKKKKKKQQQLADGISQVEIAIASSVKEEVEKKQRKEKKVKDKTAQVKAEKEEEEEQQAGKDKVPKKVKKAKKNVLAVSTEESEEPSKEKKKKKKKTTEEETSVAVKGVNATKKKPKMPENGVKLEPQSDTEVEEVKMKKKKKKDAKTKEDENGVETPEIKGNNKRTKAPSGKKLNKDSGSNESEIVIREEEETKKKGKKEKGRKAPVEVSEVEETEPKKKKRKKESAKGKEEPSFIKCEENEDGQREANDTRSKKDKKKRKNAAEVEQVENDVRVETGAKKKKKKIKEEVEDEQEYPQKDVVFLSEKSGNTDEVTINQERRQALQMEIDKASQPEKPAKPLGLGQWSTAQFNSCEQQQKFLRLMGGFKKGFQPATGSSSGGANMAMGKEAQQQLQQGLLGEFERAHSRRMDFTNRGAGLGFTAPSNKKFSIDINASRSVRFDD
ncbi:lysine-rich nucleolar protein 1 isoform X1 [Lates japonicus]